MAKQLRISDPGRGSYRGSKKKTGHGSYKAKRKPNSPMVQLKNRQEAAANFGKCPKFRADIYGIVEEATEE